MDFATTHSGFLMIHGYRSATPMGNRLTGRARRVVANRSWRRMQTDQTINLLHDPDALTAPPEWSPLVVRKRGLAVATASSLAWHTWFSRGRWSSGGPWISPWRLSRFT